MTQITATLPIVPTRGAVPFVPSGDIEATSTEKQFDNGLRVRTEGKVDTYELPVGTDGVPRTVTVEHRGWWRSDKLTAVDGSGQKLKARWSDTALWITDARTGTTTKIDTESHDISVLGKETSKTRPILNGSHNITTRALVQQLKSNGEMRILTHHRVEEKTVVYGMVRDMPPNCSTVIQHDEDYEETLLQPSGDAPRTIRWHEERYRERANLGEVPSRLDQSGDLVLAGENGQEETFRLFIPPHSMARQAI